MAEPQRSNFAHLARLQADLAQLGGRAERFFSEDPNTCLLKLRQFAELMAQQVAARAGLYVPEEDNQATLLNRLRQQGWLPREVADLFHWIRKAGNEANHQLHGSHAQALQGLKMAAQLGVWFHRSFHDVAFKGGAFIPPPVPVDETAELQHQLAELQEKLQHSDAARQAEAEKSETAAQQLAQAQADARLWEELAQSVTSDADAAKAQLTELLSLQAQAAGQSTAFMTQLQQTANQSASHIDLDEAATRVLIDQQLREAGWEADSVALNYRSHRTTPEPGRNMAIAEWPCEGGDRADYALFTGTRLVAVVEAKRASKNVSGDIEQAKRYARGIIGDGGEVLDAQWQGKYRLPFVYATNGRPFQRQYQMASGVWFCDLRRAQNTRKPLEGWHTPTGLSELLKQDIDAATAKLDATPVEFEFPLRRYQREAILAVEAAIKAGQQELLVAMATGTGKTKTCIALVYRLLKAQRFRRILFLVDRSALGEQAADSFKDTRIENLQAFADIFGIKEIDEAQPEADTMVHIATVQGMVKRALDSEDGGIPIDAYDCIVIDECHRGYLLDREMSQAESEFRDQSDYISKYRRVLDHFDAVKIGLTATPALHTSEIFGKPVYVYSYREAVLDGWLIDHDPATVIQTELSKGGIHYAKGDEVLVLNAQTKGVDSYKTPDDLGFDVSQFNKKVLTEDFNRVVCTELTRHIDPYGPAKTLVFCATDEHADLVVRLLKQAYRDAGFDEVGDDTIVKITGASDKPLALIKHYKNENNPTIAVTVDLLTTGIDVPAISNLVFLRRVNSRILYEQMLGRATRRCDEIGKDVFRIFDAVDLYKSLEPFNSMQPVVVNPGIGFTQLIREITEHAGKTIADEARDQLLAKWQRKKRHLTEMQTAALESKGIKVDDFGNFLKRTDIHTLAAWLKQHKDLGELLDKTPDYPKDPVVVSKHGDRIADVGPAYGKPEDYLERFTQFIKDNGNKLPALVAVVQRPRDLTRKDLKELVAALEGNNFDEKSLTHAWAQAKNHEIAARVLGFVRQAALGEALVPWEQRVDNAVQVLVAKRGLNPNQHNWLKKIAAQIKANIVLDEQSINEGPLREQGGFRRLNQLFEGQLNELLADMSEAIWLHAANQ